MSNLVVSTQDMNFATSTKLLQEYKDMRLSLSKIMTEYLHRNTLTLNEDIKMLQALSISSYTLFRYLNKRVVDHERASIQGGKRDFCDKCKTYWINGFLCDHLRKQKEQKDIFQCRVCSKQHCNNIDHLTEEQKIALVKDGLML